MLQSMRRQGASIFVYLIFGALVVIFVLGINPGQKDGSSGCTPAGNTVLEVDGSKIHKNAYLVAYANRFNQARGKERTYAAIEMLIRRELLAQAAAERGLRVDDDMIQEAIKKGYFFYGGHRIPMGEMIFDNHDDGTKTWSATKFKSWYGSLNISKKSYLDEQSRGMQAALMQELLINSARVSREEALSTYIHRKTTVTYDVVAFSPASYRGAMKLSDADIQRYLATHEDEVKAKFKTDERTYKDVKPQLKIRQILIAKAEPAAAKPDDAKPDDKQPADAKPDDKQPAEKPPADAKPDDKKAADAKQAADAKKVADAKKAADDKKAADAKKAAGDAAKKPAGLPIEEAKAKLEAARTAIASNKRKFVDVAKELSTDEAMKASGGDIGWRTADNAQLGDKALSDAVKALKPGEMTPVIVTDRGAYLILVEDKRPVGDAKDLTYDQVKHEIAAELARDLWSKEAAKRAALAALAAAEKGNKKLGELFEREQQLMPQFDPNMTDEERNQFIQEQLRRQMEQGQSGAIEWESKDIPVAWKAPGDSAGGSNPPPAEQPAATGSAAIPAAGSATIPATGNATGSAAAGSGTGSAPTTPPKPPIATTPAIEASKDVLPEFADVPKPKVVMHGPTPRKEQLPGVPKELTGVLFDELTAGTLARRVYEVGGSFVLVQLTGKGEPKMEDFDKEADRLIATLRQVRAAYLVEDWLKTKCEALYKDEKIKPAAGLLQEDTDDKGNPLPVTYKPCVSFR